MADDDHTGYYANITLLCGKHKWAIWNNETNDFGPCFFKLSVVSPAHALLAIFSAYYIGLSSAAYYLRTNRQKYVVYLRILSVLILTISPFVCFVINSALHSKIIEEEGISYYIGGSLEIFSWLLHFVYVCFILERVTPSIRGKRGALCIFFIVLIVDCLQCKTRITSANLNTAFGESMKVHAIVRLCCLGVYLCTLIPAGDDSESQYEELNLTNERLSERTPLTRSFTEYGGFREDNDPHYLGVARENSTRFGKLFLYWVNPLIKKGQKDLIKTPDDVFDVPPGLGTLANSEKFQQMYNDPRSGSMFRILYKLYGKEFMIIGILKFIADCAGFFSPILLNLVVKFMEDSSEDDRLGYVYAIGLSGTTFLVALCNTHFNLLISELKLKVRAAIVTAVYKHVIGVATVELNKFNTGEVLNFMSTDTDRVVNFGPSLHAVWSLPFQLIVTIFLLYQQLGVSSMTGVVITILMIPLNKLIADKIGSMSTKMMSAKDDRVQSMSELLMGIRVVKYMGWEPYFASRIHKTRKEELKYLKGRKYLDAVCVYLWATTPVLISVLTFACFVLLGNHLTAAKVFTSVALFAMLTGPLNAFPWALNGLVESFVSIRRISEFLALSKINPEDFYAPFNDVVDEERTEKTIIAISRAMFSHKPSKILQENEFRLNKITLEVNEGELLGVLGKVGSGKSSLLSSILGEMTRVSGKIAVKIPFSGIGYVQQEPWLQQGTIRDNILFGKSFQNEWYNTVIESCALSEDLKQLSKGDLTNVGEHGSMLSGGQKARVALARAVYQDKDIYLIDDIFSALDIPVGQQIFKRCINGLLRNKTRVLCTHHPKFLNSASNIVVMENGKIIETGAPGKILPKQQIENERTSLTSRRKSLHEFEDRKKKNTNRRSSSFSIADDETQESGAIDLKVYKAYWKSVGSFLSVSILTSLVLMQASRNYTDIFLAEWVNVDESKTNVSTTHYLITYGSIAITNSVFSCLRAFLFAYGGICAANVIHERLLGVILKAKTWFFDTTPTGRILNRFSSDLYTVDDSLPFILNIFLAQVVGVVGPVLVCAYAVPWIIIVMVPLAFILYDVQLRYRPASRDLKRIGSVSLSPIYAHFSETLSGLQTIRAMSATRRFITENEEKVESNTKASYAGVAAAQWLELRLQLIGCAVVTGIAIISVIQHQSGSISPGLVGLGISYALGITGKLSGLVSAFTETEREFVAVERCKQYIDEVQIEDFDGGVTTTPYNWPSEGIIVFKDVGFKYSDNLPMALEDLSFETKGREKVGIVGRTGSGKSSVFQVLFRTMEVAKGEVTIDGVNIRHLNLAEVRHHLSIIPQDPFLFHGTVRENLDPLGRCSDLQLWDALRKCHLSSAIDRIGGLEGELDERGRSFSVGQKQLLCVARAILSSAKVVCVDEATANVDLETDKLVQDTLRTALNNCTVITIAHRVQSLIGSDRVIVMDSGRAVEVGHPNILLQDPSSKFSQFVSSNR